MNKFYENWILNNEPNITELEAQQKKNFPYQPIVSIIIPTFNILEHFLCDTIDSIMQQTYEKWEVCIADSGNMQQHIEKIISRYTHDPRIKYKILEESENILGKRKAALQLAKGDYIGLLNHGDTLAPFALYEIVKAINDHHQPEVIYSDEDRITYVDKERFVPFFKPDFAPDTLRSYNYISHFCVFKQSLVERIGSFNSKYDDDNQDYDLILRATEIANHVVHISKILYHLRTNENPLMLDTSSKMYAYEAGKRVLSEHIQRIGLKGSIDFGNFLGSYKIKYELNDSKKISIIIPNKDHINELDCCLRSIYSKTTYDNYEIIIVENNSTDVQTFEYYESLKRYDNLTVVKWKETGFNYSAIVNYGVLFAKGEYLLLLNNDVEVITPTWIEEMVMYLQRDDVGIVGAKLYYPNDTVQHAGVFIIKSFCAGHVAYKLPKLSHGYYGRASMVQNISAVTGACLMTKKNLFHEVSGLDENLFTIHYNDIDLCMKIRKLDKLAVFTPIAELYHHESKSRKDDVDNLDRVRAIRERNNFLTKWAKELEKGDPYYNSMVLISAVFGSPL